ncbi:hypothetical protein ALP77_200076 [Pseudomonas amygdali pv. tabaci]|nr:hypothetical protein ALP77_200076 [Pseudomonas amygdali pv. tabaci]
MYYHLFAIRSSLSAPDSCSRAVLAVFKSNTWRR